MFQSTAHIMIINSVFAMITMVILMVIGCLITKTKWCDERAQGFVSKLVFNITLPCTIIVAFLKNFSSEMMSEYSTACLAAGCATVAIYLVAKLFVRILRLERNKRGIFTMLCSVSNCGIVGFPLAMILFGEESSVATVLFIMVQNVLMNVAGYLEISADGDSGIRPTKKETLKRVFNPLMLTSMGSLIAALVGLAFDMLPLFVTNTLELIDGITAPLSIIFIGMVMGSIGIKNLTLKRGMPTMFLLRFVGAPGFVMLFGWLFGVDGYIITVFTIISALSSMVAISIIAKTVGANVKYAATGIFYTTLISFVAVPVYSIITTALFS